VALFFYDHHIYYCDEFSSNEEINVRINFKLVILQFVRYYSIFNIYIIL